LRTRSWCRANGRLKRCGQAGEAVLVGEENVQVGGQLGITSQPLPAVRRLPRFQRLQVRRHHLIQKTLAVHGGDRAVLVHAAPPTPRPPTGIRRRRGPPPRRDGEGRKTSFCSPSPLRGGGRGEGSMLSPVTLR